MNDSVGTAAKQDRIPRAVLVIAASAAMMGLLYGYDNGNIGGAALFFSADLHFTTSEVSTVTAAIVWGELIGAFFGGWVSNKIGRRKAIITVAAGYLVCCLASGLAQDEVQLWVARFFVGLAVGLSIVAVPLFAAESVPARIRGRVLVLYQVMATSGLIVGYLVAAALSQANPEYNWRIMLGLAAVPALVLLPIVIRLPETAYWLVMKGRLEDAAATLRRTNPQVDPDLELDEMQATLASQSGGNIGEMFRRPYLRATLFVVIFGFFIQITGVNAAVTYGPQLFKSMGISSNVEAILMGALVQCFALVGVLVAMRNIDRWGRRPVLMTGISILIVGQLISAATFLTVDANHWSLPQQIAGFCGLALVQIGFVFGFGSLVWVYASEAFPGRLRAYGTSALLSADLLANVVVAQFTLIAIDRFGQSAVFLAFAAFALLALLFVFKFAPETKGRPLDDIRFFWENNGKWPVAQTPAEAADQR